MKVTEMWLHEARAFHREGGCFVLTNHPFLVGRPGRAHMLEQLIEDVKALDGMWVTTLHAIAEHTAGLGLEPFTHRRLSDTEVDGAFSHLDG